MMWSRLVEVRHIDIEHPLEACSSAWGYPPLDRQRQRLFIHSSSCSPFFTWLVSWTIRY